MNDELFAVADQVVLVSGGSRGIGRELARGFAARGAQVIVTGRDQDTLERTVRELSERPAGAGDGRIASPTHPVAPVVCDVARPEQTAAAVGEVIDRFGRIDALINVAGVNIRKPALEYSPDQFDFVLDVNLRGAFFMAEQVGRHLLERGAGCVINIDSINSDLPLAHVAPYAMSKCGLSGMTQVLAQEWGPRGVRVNGLAPGFILTDLTRQLWSDPTMQEWGRFNTPLRRLGQPADLVGTAVFLASPAAAFLTGQTIYVDGGFTAGRNWPIPPGGGQSD